MQKMSKISQVKIWILLCKRKPRYGYAQETSRKKTDTFLIAAQKTNYIKEKIDYTNQIKWR